MIDKLFIFCRQVISYIKTQPLRLLPCVMALCSLSLTVRLSGLLGVTGAVTSQMTDAAPAASKAPEAAAEPAQPSSPSVKEAPQNQTSVPQSEIQSPVPDNKEKIAKESDVSDPSLSGQTTASQDDKEQEAKKSDSGDKDAPKQENAQQTPPKEGANNSINQTVPNATDNQPLSPNTATAVSDDNTSNNDDQNDEHGDFKIDLLNLTEEDITRLRNMIEQSSQVEKKLKLLETQEAALKITESRVQKKIDEMNNLKRNLNKLLEDYKKAQDQSLQNIVKIYDSMKPKEAAAIFNQLDEKILMTVISMMKESKTGPILALMDPGRVGKITEKMMTRTQLGKDTPK